MLIQNSQYDFWNNFPEFYSTPEKINKALELNSKKIEKARKICKKFNPVILEKTNNSVVIQVTALRAEIDKLALDLKSLGLISTSRTGAVAMTKGPKIFN